jgi:hypothetical protein
MSSQRTLIAALVVTLGSLSASVLTPATAHAQALPSPKDLVSGLDLECYRTPGPALNFTVMLSQLNPVLIAAGLPPHPVIIRELQQTCVPVMKNNVVPPPTALPFIRHIDFACYRVEAAPLPSPIPLTLRHLNPVLGNLPPHDIRLLRPSQLCLPVAKNNLLPPAQVLALARFIDLECYETQAAQHPLFAVGLTQLNPQLGNIPPHAMTLTSDRREMCVPVRKNNQVIPPAILNIVRWIDLEKFLAQPVVATPPISVALRHLNPLFTTLAPIPVVLQFATNLMVPVAKNNMFPPPQ